MARSFLSLFLILACCYRIQAQSTTNEIRVSPVIPPSPNAASLGQYGEIPVSKYTGVPNIDIPLYTIEEDDITIPISLSFHAAGHKVGQRAGWNGLGWSLNSGGVVTRSMRGRPDESYGYFDNINTVLNWTDVQRSYILLSSAFPSGDFSELQDDVAPVKEQMWLWYNQNKDLEPDLFYYNFPGGSGKFMFNENQDIIQLPFRDMRISPQDMTLDNDGNGEISGFKIYDPSGLEYLFREDEQTAVTLPNDDQDTYFSSWYLTSIFSRKSYKSIDFNYDIQTSVAQDPVSSFSQTELVDNINGVGDNFGDRNEQISNTTIAQKFLTSIGWDQGLVRFISSTGRLDSTPGDRKLDEIIVENKAGDIIKHYKFVYNYFEDNSQEGYRSKFLKLTEILEVDLDGNERTAYSFTYYGNPPHRGSYAIDHLGFYNAQTSNKHLIPTYTRAQGIATVNGADRDPRGGASKVGMLESITYPTGGKTTFDYEAHDHYTGSSETKWVPRGHVAHAEYCNDEGIFTYDYDPEDTECQNPEGIRGLLCERVVEAVMEIPQGARNFEISIVPLFNEDGCDPVAIELGDLKVDIYELVGEQEILVWPYATNNLNQEEFDLDNKLFGGKTYVLRSESKVRGARIKGAVTYEVLNKNIQSVNTQTSGVRIKRITHENLAGYGPERQISYTYRQKRHGDRSSGRMLARNPSYGYEFEDRSGKNFVQTGNPVGALGTLNNSHIIYTEVKEEELGNGYTWSTFSFSGDELLPTIIEAPARLEMASSAWKGGHLIKEEIFDNDGNVLKWTENSYSYISKGTSSTFIYELKTDFTPPDWMNEFRWALGYQRSGWARLDETREYTHDKEAGLVLSSKTSYTYQPEESKLLLPIRIDYLLDDLSFYETIEYMDHRAPYHVIDPVRERTTFNNNNEVLEQLINSYGGQSDFDTYKLTRQRRLNSSGGVFAEQNLQYSDEIEQGSKPSYSSNHSGDKTQYLYSESTFDPVAKIVQTDPGLSFYNGFEEHPNATGARAKTGLKALNSGSYQITIEMFAPSSEAGLKMSYWFWDGDSWEFSGELDFNRNVNSAGSMIDELRVYQSGALMTTYTYKPLVGIITVTDPNNITTYYEYDHLNRLLGIRDEEGNIIENYHYQYWNE